MTRRAARSARVVIALAVALGPINPSMAAVDPSRMALTAEQYRLLPSSGRVTPEGSRLCVAMGMPASFPCNASTILDAAQQQTDPALQIDRTIGGLPSVAPHYCGDPVVLERTPSRDGQTESVVLGCHRVGPPRSVTKDLSDRLVAAIERLHAINPKTLAQHEMEGRVLRLLDAVERMAP